MTIADRIRNRRLELGLSVDDLAKLLNKNRATVYRYESNYIKTYQPDVMESLALALQTTPSYFYGYDDVPVSVSPEQDPQIRTVSGVMSSMSEEQKEQIVAIVLAYAAHQAK